jgi:carbonic anhydrase
MRDIHILFWTYCEFRSCTVYKPHFPPKIHFPHQLRSIRHSLPLSFLNPHQHSLNSETIDLLNMYHILLALVAATSIIACPEHNSGWESNSLTRRATAEKDWSYDTSYDWGSQNPSEYPPIIVIPIIDRAIDYTLCKTGTMQAPIGLKKADGFANTHKPTFNYTTHLSGNLFNWNYGPAFDVVSNSTSFTSSASFTFDNETVYLKGWHIHSPADHSVDGVKARSELHLVHGDETGKAIAVLAILINPGTTDSPFVAQFASAINSTTPDSTQVPNFNSEDRIPLASMDVGLALKEAGDFEKYWTYKGGLTSPPCSEGIRFFVSSKVMTVGTEQMQEILRVSAYSAREEQMVWMHEVNV